MTFEKSLAEEGANWIAEMVSEDLGGFIPAELVDMIMDIERRLRLEQGDAEMDHESMAALLLPILGEAGVPTHFGGVTEAVLVEVLHWEDEFVAMAGQPRTVRPSR